MAGANYMKCKFQCPQITCQQSTNGVADLQTVQGLSRNGSRLESLRQDPYGQKADNICHLAFPRKHLVIPRVEDTKGRLLLRPDIYSGA